jgi:2-hydroxymuconate-semialdehyde hydrolase
MNAKSKKLRARVAGGELAFIDAGRGPAVVLLHGFPTSSFLWRAFVPALAMGGMRVVAIDFLGYGDSDKPKGAALDVRAQAGYVRELLTGLGIDRFAVVGHDLGGAVAQLLCLDGGVEAMVLIDTVAFDAWPIEGVRMLQEARPDQETPDFVRSVVDLTLDLGVAHAERVTEQVREAYAEPFAHPAGARAFFRAVRAIDGLGLAGREADLGSLEIPVLLLWGEEDPFLPVELAERLNEAMPTSSLALLPGCSHFLPEDAPETLVPLVYEYLRNRYLGRSHGHGDGHEHPSGTARGSVPIEIRPLRSG